MGPIEGRQFEAEEFTRIHLKGRFLGVDLSEKGQHILPPNVVVYYLRPPTLPCRSLPRSEVVVLRGRQLFVCLTFPVLATFVFFSGVS